MILANQYETHIHGGNLNIQLCVFVAMPHHAQSRIWLNTYITTLLTCDEYHFILITIIATNMPHLIITKLQLPSVSIRYCWTKNIPFPNTRWKKNIWHVHSSKQTHHFLTTLTLALWTTVKQIDEKTTEPNKKKTTPQGFLPQRAWACAAGWWPWCRISPGLRRRRRGLGPAW